MELIGRNAGVGENCINPLALSAYPAREGPDGGVAGHVDFPYLNIGSRAFANDLSLCCLALRDASATHNQSSHVHLDPEDVLA